VGVTTGTIQTQSAPANAGIKHHGNVADSWVGTGQNQPIQANDLGNALGPQVIREIAQRTGLNEQDLLKQLSAALPGVVDQLTPNGQVPQQHQVASAFNSQ
jgi:uncharacterized protein YidB (DUF937 family)